MRARSIVEFAVGVVDGDRPVAACDGHHRAEVETPAVKAFAGIEVDCIVVVEHREDIFRAGEVTGALDILAHGEELQNTEVVVAAEVDVVLILFADGSRFLRTPHHLVVGDDGLQIADRVGRGDAGVAVGRGLAFDAVFFGGVVLEGILARHLEAREFGRLIGDHVVVDAGAREAEDVVVAAVEAVAHEVDDVVGARGARERAHAAEREGAEAAFKRDARFAVEQLVFGGHRARIGSEFVFKVEGDLHAVAEVFGAGDAEARGFVHRRFHRERVFGGFAARLAVREHKAGVDGAEDGNVGCLSGGEDGTEGEENKTLFHDEGNLCSAVMSEDSCGSPCR